MGYRKVINHFLFYIVVVIAIASCVPSRDYKDYNYYNGTRLYNDSLNLTVKFPGDVRFDQDIKKRKVKKEVRILRELKKTNLLTYGKTVIPPYYQLFLLYKPGDKISDSIHLNRVSELILKDTVTRSVVYKSGFGNQALYLIIKGDKKSKSMISEISDGKNIIESIKFDYSEEDLLGYWDVFNTYSDENNILYLKEKLDKAPIEKTQQSEWDKQQIMLTLLSRDPDNKEFLDLSINPRKRTYFQKLIDKAIRKEDEVFQSRTRALEEIERLAQNKRVVMLNESHWLPRHRIFASQLLAPLKKAEYHYLAVEAVYEEKDKFLNKHKVPLNSTGYYVREPYFGLFLRKARQLGFTIISYDRFDTENREIAQAENILKIIEDDSKARVFVYAGLAHINEKTDYVKRMAEYLKEMSGIDPLTINQELVEGNTDEDVILFKTETFPEDEKIRKNVDYFLLNNIKPDLVEFYPEESFIDLKIKIPELRKYKNRKVYISIYLSEEYDKFKRNTVPIKNQIYKVKDSNIQLYLPRGTYQLKIWDNKNNLVLSKKMKATDAD